MHALRTWLRTRLGTDAIHAKILDREIPDRLTIWHTLGSATLTTFLVLVATGVVLATYYSPAPDHAYDSIWYVENEVLGGSLVRAMHHWSASAMVVLMLAHMIRVFTWGSYKYPREANWWVGVGLFLIVLAFSFTGYLLPWDQKAYWATQIGIGMAGTTPIVGGVAATALQGGAQLGAATLARFYAFHTLWLPGLFGLLVAVHLGLVVKHGVSPRGAVLEDGAPPSTTHEEYPAYYERAYKGSQSGVKKFWPDIVAKDVIVSLVVLTLIVSLSAVSGAGLEAPADPSDTSYVPTPEWYFLPLYQLLKIVPGSMESVIAVGVPAALILSLLALPLIDRRSTRRISRRPIGASALVLLLGGSGYLIGAAHRELDFEAPQQSSRPLSSAARAGAALYRAHGCGDCHVIDGEGGGDGPDLTDIGMRHSVAWLHSFIENPTAFREDSDMPAYGPPQVTHQEIEELSQYLATLRGDVPMTAVPSFADTFPEIRR